jgi:hypothetical protein
MVPGMTTISECRVNHINLKALTISGRDITLASVHVASCEQVDPIHGWSQLAVIESPVKTTVYRGWMVE